MKALREACASCQEDMVLPSSPKDQMGLLAVAVR